MRYKVSIWHGERVSIYRVIDSFYDSVLYESSTRRTGAKAGPLAFAYAKQMNRQYWRA